MTGEAERTSALPATGPAAGRGRRHRLVGMHVLAVEDDRDSQLLLVHSLKIAGARVTAVSNALEALRLIRVVTPDVLVSDIAMPWMDGHGLIQRVRMLPGRGTLPAIAVSAFASPEDCSRSIDSGFDEHLAKPLDFDHLISSIQRLVARDRMI